MEFKKLNYSLTKGVANIQLNSPQNLNALDGPMLDDLMTALDLCEDDTQVKVVVIEGAGNSFSAGGDIRAMIKGVQDNNMSGLVGGVRKVGAVALKIRNLRKPIIASVRGSAAGAGCNLALACDFRIASEDAKFIQSFINVGLVPDMGGTFLLTRILGVARATELIMTGQAVTAQEAKELGFVNKIVPLEKLEEATAEFAARLGRLPGIAIANMKALINRAAFQGFENSIENEVEYQSLCAQTEDFKEGIMAFAEKRKPNFQGK